MVEGLDLANMTNSQREDIMSKVKQEMLMANAQEVLQVSSFFDYCSRSGVAFGSLCEVDGWGVSLDLR